MTLSNPLDPFDEATHKELDTEVYNAAKDDLGDVTELRFAAEYRALLYAIIAHSKGELDKKYGDRGNAKELFSTHGDLREMLASAWRDRSFRAIRNLAFLKAPKELVKLKKESYMSPDLRRSLSIPFEAEYRGVAVDGFYEYLSHNEKLFKTVDNPRYYAKLCSIVQTSGTGKSRMITELGKKGVIVIYMNLREKNDKLSFPARDPIPSIILTEFPSTEEEYRITCYAFFIALFKTLSEYFSKSYHPLRPKDGIMNWVRQMCDMSYPSRSTARADFFAKLAEMYEKELDLSDPTGFVVRVCIAYDKMAGFLKNIFSDNSNKPKLVIALDEAHTLTPMPQRNYRPADVFSRVVNEYSHYENHAVWVAFASTTSKIADFFPPNQKHNSDRVAIRGKKLFPPYTQLGWDQNAFGLGDIGVEDVSQIGHIAGYGRPLWLSLRSALTLTESVLGSASSKLCAGRDFDPQKTGHVLAVLGQRFGLNVTFGHPDSVEHLENGVASHLRVCLATTLDRNWRFTSYPSEPLLSCVAAMDLHEMPEKLGVVLGTLLAAVKSGMIDMGQRGELASRLLWLLAKDLFIRTKVKDGAVQVPSKWDEHLADCQMIPVVDWLEFIFGPQIWPEDDRKASLACEMFENAYLNFSHWVCVDADISGSEEEDELPLDEFTLRHWQRTCAVQCSHQQPGVDKVIPIYFKGGPENAPAESRMSQIFISDRARGSTASKKDLAFITRLHNHIGGDGGITSDSKSLPYIAIMADLGWEPSFSVTLPERDVDDRCLRIYAAGVETGTYPFLAKYPALRETLEDLVRLRQIPETERPYTQYLNAQVKYGSTATPEHLVWEDEKCVSGEVGKHAQES